MWTFRRSGGRHWHPDGGRGESPPSRTSPVNAWLEPRGELALRARQEAAGWRDPYDVRVVMACLVGDAEVLTIVEKTEAQGDAQGGAAEPAAAALEAAE